MVEHPEPSQGVLNQVAYDPMRGEELGGCRDFPGPCLLSLLEVLEYFVLPLTDVILIQPANDFYILASIFC